MPRRASKRQGKRRRAQRATILDVVLVEGKAVALGGGGLVAELRRSEKSFVVDILLRTKGGGDMQLFNPRYWRESRELAAKSAEELLVRLSSALRQAGAS